MGLLEAICDGHDDDRDGDHGGHGDDVRAHDPAKINHSIWNLFSLIENCHEKVQNHSKKFLTGKTIYFRSIFFNHSKKHVKMI